MHIDREFRIFPARASRLLAVVCALAGVGLSGCSTTLAQFEPAREVVCFAGAKVSLADAVAAAASEGGRVVKAHYHQSEELGCLSGNPGVYEVAILRGGEVVDATVDVRTKAVSLQTGGANGGAYYGKVYVDDPTSQARAALEVPLRMADAIRLAERTGGRAIKAYVDVRDGRPGYVVKLVKTGGKVHPAWIDGGLLALSSDELPDL